MSDQPKLTGEQHHPSCRESDKELVWHCGQCGLNESAADIENQLHQPKPIGQLAPHYAGRGLENQIQPKPKIGKPTGQRLAVASEWTTESASDMAFPSTNANHGPWKRIADAHNAALAAKNKQIKMLEQLAVDLPSNQQLAAEQKDHTEHMKSVQDFYSRKLVEENTRALAAEKQLATEREKVHTLVELLGEAREVLSVADDFVSRIDAALAKVVK